MTDWQCARCRAQVAPGAPRCPQCPSTEFEKPEPEMLKITRDGSVSDSADVQAAEAAEGGELAGIEARLDGHGAGDPQTGQEAAGDAQPVPPAPPRVPPRRTPPPGAPGD